MLYSKVRNSWLKITYIASTTLYVPSQAKHEWLSQELIISAKRKGPYRASLGLQNKLKKAKWLKPAGRLPKVKAYGELLFKGDVSSEIPKGMA